MTLQAKQMKTVRTITLKKNEEEEPDKSDADEGDGSEIGRDEGEDSVSGNSVSENSVSENTVVSEEQTGLSVQKNVSVEASGGLGSLLMDELQIAAQEEASAAAEE